MAKFKIGDKLICISFDKEKYKEIERGSGGSGYKLDRVIIVATITEHKGIPIYWSDNENIGGIYEFALDFIKVLSAQDLSNINNLIDSFDEII